MYICILSQQALKYDNSVCQVSFEPDSNDNYTSTLIVDRHTRKNVNCVKRVSLLVLNYRRKRLGKWWRKHRRTGDTIKQKLRKVLSWWHNKSIQQPSYFINKLSLVQSYSSPCDMLVNFSWSNHRYHISFNSYVHLPNLTTRAYVQSQYAKVSFFTRDSGRSVDLSEVLLINSDIFVSPAVS